jgi:hypothetical protein
MRENVLPLLTVYRHICVINLWGALSHTKDWNLLAGKLTFPI